MTNQQIAEEIKGVGNLQGIIETYETISATKMQDIRASVLSNRNYLAEINFVFQQVKKSYREQLELLMKSKKIKTDKFTLFKTNGKTLFVLLSANTSLYGNILKDTYNLFKRYITAQDGDILIIGKLGQELYDNDDVKKQFIYKDLEDNNVDSEKIKDIAQTIMQYEKVIVFHGKFETTIDQSPALTSISGDPLPGELQTPSIKYFFEPSLEEVMLYFEKEMFTSFFEQTVQESMLAKHASRMISLDRSIENIKSQLFKLNFDKERIKHLNFNKKQLETVSSIRLWKYAK